MLHVYIFSHELILTSALKYIRAGLNHCCFELKQAPVCDSVSLNKRIGMIKTFGFTTFDYLCSRETKSNVNMSKSTYFFRKAGVKSANKL